MSSRPPSVFSRKSVSSTLTDLFRGSSRRSVHCPSSHSFITETSSILSTSSKSSFFFPKGIFKRTSSNPSLRPDISGMSAGRFSSQDLSDGQFHYQHHPRSGVGGAVGRVAKYSAAPPSSFPARCFAPRGVYFDECLSTAKEIREEISAVEAEARRINGVFDDITSTASSSLQPRARGSHQDLKYHGDNRDSTWALLLDGGFPRREPESYVKPTPVLPTGTTSPPSHDALRRRETMLKAPLSLHCAELPATTSQGTHGLRSALSPPLASLAMPGFPSINVAYPGHGGDVVTISSSHRLTTQTHSSQNDTSPHSIQWAEVMNRYEARLDYLRAKLKSAELHEMLLRK
jgi:hypothetical protein